MTSRRTALGFISVAALTAALPMPGGWSAAQSSGAPLDVSIDINTPPLMIAPAGVMFEAKVANADLEQAPYPNDYQPDFHRLFYVWSFPDHGPARAPEHLVDAHRRTDRAMGPFVSRVFETSGRHRISVDVFAPDGRRGRAEAFVTIDDHTKSFAPLGTIIVAPDGDFKGAPAHDPRNRFKDIKTAHKRYGQLGVDQVQILLKRGHSHVMASERALSFKKQKAHCHIGAWGDGTRPVVDMRKTGGTFINLQAEWSGHALVLRDLHFRGAWNPTTELWEGAVHKSLVQSNCDAALLLHDCREDGCTITVNSRAPRKASANGAMTFINEYDKTDFKDFLLLGPRENVDVAITGCRVVQHPDALNGGENRGATSYGLYGRNAHSFVRCSARRLYIASNDIFIRHGWGGFLVHDNSPFRLNRNDVADMRVVIARNHIEGMVIRRSKRGAVPMNLLVEQNYIVSNPTVPRPLFFEGGAASIRNNIVLEHNTPKPPKSGTGFRAFVTLTQNGDNAKTRQMPFFVTHNSFISLRDETTNRRGPMAVLNDETYFPNVTQTNNLLWAPQMAKDVGTDGPLDTTPLNWDARYRGVRLGWARLRSQNMARNVFPGGDILIPYWDDFFGTPLRATDFAGEAGRHALTLRIEGKRQNFDALEKDIRVTFETRGVRVVNLSGVRWPKGASYNLHCDRGTTPMAMQRAYAHPKGTLALYRPLASSGAWKTAQSQDAVPYDFLGNLRPMQPSRGAIEPQ